MKTVKRRLFLTVAFGAVAALVVYGSDPETETVEEPP
jgi:hypothetical protein